MQSHFLMYVFIIHAGGDIHALQRINPNDFGDALTFPPGQKSGSHLLF